MKSKFIVFILLVALLSGCAAPAAEPAQEAPVEENVIRVSTPDELIAAVAPGAVIELAEGEFTLTPPAGGGEVNQFCRWTETYDGFALEIHNVKDLTIRGAGADKTTVSAVPRYANVISFFSCDGVTVADLTAGHTREPGACSGGVLLFDSCSGARVERCGLFGCGTTGVGAQFCHGLTVSETSIYECSYSAVSVYDCRDTLVQDCDVYRIGVDSDWPASCLFESYGGEGLTVVGCRIRDNAAQALLSSGLTRNIRFLSNDVRGSRFDIAVFALDRYPAAVDGCSFSDNGYPVWCSVVRPVNAAGEALDDAALETMELREIDPAQVVFPEQTAAAEVAPGGEIRVASTDELLAAIGPDRTVVLAPGNYDLSAAESYGGLGGIYYFWQDTYDGYELVIDGVQGLTIRAEAPYAGDTSVTAVSRYANVLSFRNCQELSLAGFTAGHTPDQGECTGGVIDLQYCSGIDLDGCRLYGCGVTGVNTWQCVSLSVRNCEIFDCSWNAATISATDGVVFDGCDIHDVPSPALYISDCSDRLWNGLPFENGMYDVAADGALTEWQYDDGGEYGEYYAPTGTPFRVDSPELAFALEVQRVFAQGDWEALAELAGYPLRIYTQEGNYVFQDAESLRPERLDQLLTSDFRQTVARAGLDEYVHTDMGSVFAYGSLAFECFVTAQGEELRITAISTLFDLDI